MCNLTVDRSVLSGARIKTHVVLTPLGTIDELESTSESLFPWLESSHA